MKNQVRIIVQAKNENGQRKNVASIDLYEDEVMSCKLYGLLPGNTAQMVREAIKDAESEEFC